MDNNPFLLLPNEVFGLLLLSIHWKDLRRLPRVCKFFAEHRLLVDEQLWRKIGLSWWEKRKRKDKYLKDVSLETLVMESELVDPTKSWKWFAICFGEHLHKIQSLAVRIGVNRGGRLEGYGVYWSAYRLETGNFKSDCLSGRGSSLWHHDKSKYFGEWKMDMQHGEGKMIWPLKNFEYSGEWYEGHPIDEEASLHPDLVRECLNNNKCTRKVTGRTGGYAQFLYSCIYCKNAYDFCSICKESCHPHETPGWQRRWTDGSFCTCKNHS